MTCRTDLVSSEKEEDHCEGLATSHTHRSQWSRSSAGSSCVPTSLRDYGNVSLGASRKCVSCGGVIPGLQSLGGCGNATDRRTTVKPILVGGCLACRRSGQVNVNRCHSSLVAICLRVIEFYRIELNIDFLPLVHQMARMSRIRDSSVDFNFLLEDKVLSLEGTMRDKAVREAIPVHVVDALYFEPNSAQYGCGYFTHQLARCDCRLAVHTTGNSEVGRWIEGIYLAGGLAFEAAGGILAHELMHAYMWLKCSQGETEEFDEAICNIVALGFLETEAAFLESALEDGDTRWEIRHRRDVCRYRMRKLNELEKKASYRLEVNKVRSALTHLENSFPALIESLVIDEHFQLNA